MMMKAKGRARAGEKPPTAQMLTNAQMKSMPKPAYAHSLMRGGTCGSMSAREPNTLNTAKRVTKYRG